MENAGIIIIGLGPSDAKLLTQQAWEILQKADRVFVRTTRHPTVAALKKLPLQLHSYDALYEQADSFELVYKQIVADLLERGRENRVIYGVPGHPMVGEATVTAILQEARQRGISVEIVAGLSFVEPTLTAVAYDGLDGLQLFDGIELAGYEYPPMSGDVPALIGQLYSQSLASALKLSLMAIYPNTHQVALVQATGGSDEQVVWLPLYELDRTDLPDHLTTLFVPALAVPSSLPALAETVAVLRSPNGCPWDQEQTSASLRGGLIEELSELLTAIEEGDEAGVCEELGDLLLHLVMQAQIYSEAETFNIGDVIAGIERKLKRRHPHVWGDWIASDSERVKKNWEQLKAEEKRERGDKSESLLDNVPISLPALAQSQKIQKRVRKVGFDWQTIDGVYEKLAEEIAELKSANSSENQHAELGDILFVLANLAKWLNIPAELALRDANRRFTRRFRQVEQLAIAQNLQLNEATEEELLALWEEAKGILSQRERA